jgi:hypothetical protein
VEPTSNCSSASGGAACAGAAAVMQAVESETLILYHTDLRGEWPAAAARALARRLRYAKRLASGGDGAGAHATLAGIALALRALSTLCGRAVGAGELVFARGAKPCLAPAAPGATVRAAPDFSIAHSGPWVGCAAARHGRVGFDVEIGGGARWAALEAVVKGSGAGLRALGEVELRRGQASCRGELWYAHEPRVFAGAAACVMTSVAGQMLSVRALALAELFAA